MRVLHQTFDRKEKREYTFGFFSDLHLDSAHCQISKFRSDADAIKKLDGRMYINGDVLDLILPQDRKRYIRGSDVTDSQAQINEIVEKATDTLLAYVDNIDGIGVGNHESSVVKYHSVDPIAWLIKNLNDKRNSKLPPIYHMGYTGYIIHDYHHGDNNAVRRLKIWYHHGVGGSSPVTKGMIDFNRAVVANDSDIYWMGHKHSSAIDPGIERMYLDKLNKPYIKTCKGFYTAGYHGGKTDHQQVGKYGYVPDFGTERFLNHSSCGMVRVDVLAGNELETQLMTARR